jgi:hypothetical protein
MSSRTVTTHTTSAPPRESGLQVGTLVIAAISSVVAAVVVSRLWQPGTLMATAMTPVIVTLVKEALERPARRVSSIAVRPPRRAEAAAPPPPAVVVTEDEGMTPMRVYRRDGRVRRHWKLAIATGLLAFLIAMAAMTLPELVAGRSVVSSSHDTTIFGGRRSTATTSKPDQKTKTEQDTVTTEQQPQDTTSTEQQTTTTQPPQSAAPAPQSQTQTTPPAQAQPAPTTTEPQPAQPQPAPTTP